MRSLPTKAGLSPNTVRRRTGRCRQFFAQAVEDGLIERNPFAGLPATVRSNKERQYYVSPDYSCRGERSGGLFRTSC